MGKIRNKTLERESIKQADRNKPKLQRDHNEGVSGLSAVGMSVSRRHGSIQVLFTAETLHKYWLNEWIDTLRCDF